MPSTTAPVYFQNAIGSVTEHHDGYVFVQYNKVQWNIEQLRVLLVHLGELLLRRGWRRILVDLRHIEPLSDREKQFVVDEWYTCKIPRPVSVVTAYILAENVFSRLAIHELQEVARKKNYSKSFAQLADAQAYLASFT